MDFSKTNKHYCQFVCSKIEFSEDIFKRSMIIYDECHRYGISSYEKLLSHKYYSSLGLTAALERKYDDGVNDYLSSSNWKVNFSVWL